MSTPDLELVSRLRAAGCVYAEEEAALLTEAASGPELEALVVRRVAGEPLEQILGWAEFDGLRIRLLPGVFVPRQRSLLLVRLVENSCRKARNRAVAGGFDMSFRVLDLGCGSGALGAAVAARTGAEVWAVDADPDAVVCARLNLPDGHVLHGDLFAALPVGLRFDAIIANLPYVPTSEIALMPSEARDHEHAIALDGGEDGLTLQRRAIAEAPSWLADGGVIALEASERQAPLTASLLRSAGLVPRAARDVELDATAVLGSAAAT